MNNSPWLPVVDNAVSPQPAPPLDVARAVQERYSAASRHAVAELCCPVNYNPAYLQAIPQEILERDYGCGDPSRYMRPGETVLDLGSGGGKICYIAAQVVGAGGRVIGVDANDDMLALARKYQAEMALKLGYANVQFRKGRIQDLALDLEAFEEYLRAHPARDHASWTAAEAHAEFLRHTQPMIASACIDVVVSNCVLNLVHRGDRQRLFAEMFRVLKEGGRTVISDIVCDKPVPQHLQQDAALWSGCISGAFVETEFLEAFVRAGFHGMRILERQEAPWRTVEGIEFRSVTVEAYKPRSGAERDQLQTVIYRGPWQSVTDDAGHVLPRGQRLVVDANTFHRLTSPPYAEHVLGVPPRQPLAPLEAPPIDGRQNTFRAPAETNGPSHRATTSGGDCCGGTCG